MNKLLVGIIIVLFLGLAGYLIFIGDFEKTNKATESTNIKSVARKKDSCLVTYVLIVNLPDGTYNKKYFRKSLAYSIDREELFSLAPVFSAAGLVSSLAPVFSAAGLVSIF